MNDNQKTIFKNNVISIAKQIEKYSWREQAAYMNKEVEDQKMYQKKLDELYVQLETFLGGL